MTHCMQYEVQYFDEATNAWLLWSDHSELWQANVQWYAADRAYGKARVIQIVRDY